MCMTSIKRGGGGWTKWAVNSMPTFGRKWTFKFMQKQNNDGDDDHNNDKGTEK